MTDQGKTTPQFVVVETGATAGFVAHGPFDDRAEAEAYARDFSFTRWTKDLHVATLTPQREP